MSSKGYESALCIDEYIGLLDISVYNFICRKGGQATVTGSQYYRRLAGTAFSQNCIYDF